MIFKVKFKITNYIIAICVLTTLACKDKNNASSQVVILTGKERIEFIEMQKSNLIKQDSSTKAELYIIKSVGVSNSMPIIYHRLIEVSGYKINDSSFYVNLSGFDFKKPYYGPGNISINICNDLSFQTELRYETDALEFSESFEKTANNRKIKILYLSDSISKKIKSISGFLDVEFYKDEKCTKKDFEACFSFSISGLK
jgi:hypothetical protein